MGLSFGSINTGLPKDIVKQLIEAEKLPLVRLEQRKSKFANKQSLVGELIQLVEDIRGNLALNANARSLRELKVHTDESIVDVTVDKNTALPGSHQIEVVQLAQKSSAMTSGFSDPKDSYVGVGYIQYTLPDGSTKEIYVDAENSSLDGIEKLINSDNGNGVNANVVNDGKEGVDNWKLILSLTETGESNKAEFPYFYFVDGEDDFYLEFQREAQNAIVKVDGFEIQLPDNKTNDIIKGATIDLKKAKPGEEFSIKITEDQQKITTKILDLVDKINGALNFIKKQNTLDESSDTSKTLGGDLILQTLESRIRAAVFHNVQTANGTRRVGDIGITFKRDGLLSFDDKKFENSVKKDFNSTAQVLTGWISPEGIKTEGFMGKLNTVIGEALKHPSGLLKARNRSLQSNIDQIDRRIANKSRLIEQKEKNLKQKFARLESTISQIRNQGAGLAALGNSGPDPVQQLG